MPRLIKAYVRYVDALNRGLGIAVMYLIFAMMGLLLFASLTRYVLNIPFVWVIEMSQFLMVAYYILGGPYSMELGSGTCAWTSCPSDGGRRPRVSGTP